MLATKRLMAPEVVASAPAVKNSTYDDPMDRKEVKKALVAALIGQLDAELSNMRRAAKDAREAATHEEAKPENDKDTRALEASYLAGAQAARVRDLEQTVKGIGGMALLDLAGKIVQASAVLTLEDEEGETTVFFYAPLGGGTSLTAAAFSSPVQVLTPQSPMGAAVLGKSKGDVIELRVKGKPRELTLVDVW